MQYNQLANFNILVVDDEKTIQRLVCDVMRSLGFRNITSANSGSQAIAAMHSTTFDFIITDWRMGDMDGIDIVRHARQSIDSRHMTTPIIMLTGNTEPHFVLSARDAGVNSYMIKPFSSAQLVKRIRTIIEQPLPFVVAPKYHGPDRRHKTLPPPGDVERRKKPKK
jgi:hypothetical protein